MPPTRVATTGRPAARASISATGVPSLQRGVHDHVEVAVDRGHVVPPAVEVHAPREAERAPPALRGRRAARRRPPPRSATPGDAIAHARRRVQERRHVLDRGEAADDADERRAVGKPASAPQAARAAARRPAARSSRPSGTTRMRSAGAMPSATRSSFTASDTATSARVRARQHALDGAEERRCGRRRNSRAARGRGTCARRRRRRRGARPRRPSTPGLGGVGVDDVRAGTSASSVRGRERPHVGQGPDLAAEAGQSHAVHALRARPARAGSLPAAPPCRPRAVVR